MGQNTPDFKPEQPRHSVSVNFERTSSVEAEILLFYYERLVHSFSIFENSFSASKIPLDFDNRY